MTKEQAIELIKEYKVAKVEFPNDLQEQALDMAIKSLEQPTSDDCVSRQAVLDKAWDVLYEGEYIQVVDVGDIQELPSVTPTQRWIPVSERLPKEGQRVFVTQIVDERTIVYCTRFPFEKTKEKYITAWMPLPKPYEEKRGSENGIEDVSKYEYICPNCGAEVVSKLNIFECWRCGAKMRGDLDVSN